MKLQVWQWNWKDRRINAMLWLNNIYIFIEKVQGSLSFSPASLSSTSSGTSLSLPRHSQTNEREICFVCLIKRPSEIELLKLQRLLWPLTYIAWTADTVYAVAYMPNCPHLLLWNSTLWSFMELEWNRWDGWVIPLRLLQLLDSADMRYWANFRFATIFEWRLEFSNVHFGDFIWS